MGSRLTRSWSSLTGFRVEIGRIRVEIDRIQGRDWPDFVSSLTRPGSSLTDSGCRDWSDSASDTGFGAGSDRIFGVEMDCIRDWLDSWSRLTEFRVEIDRFRGRMWPYSGPRLTGSGAEVTEKLGLNPYLQKDQIRIRHSKKIFDSISDTSFSWNIWKILTLPRTFFPDIESECSYWIWVWIWL